MRSFNSREITSYCLEFEELRKIKIISDNTLLDICSFLSLRFEVSLGRKGGKRFYKGATTRT